MNPKVSVIVPAFNAEATIAESLGTLTSQSMRDLEVIVVDDGSTDRTASMVARIAESSAVPIRLISQHNAGRADARNRGIDSASGEFVGFVDADDRANERMFATLLERAEKTGADMVTCEYASFEAGTGETINHYREGDSSLYGCSLQERPEILVAMGASVCNKLFRRSLFTQNALRFPSGLDFEDLATIYRLALHARRIEKVDEVLYYYRLGHSSSIMSSCDERFAQIPEALRITNDHFMAAEQFDEFRRELEIVNFVHLIHGRYADFFTCAPTDSRRSFVRAAFLHMDDYFPGWRKDPDLESVSGRRLKHTVSTHESLLLVYSALRAARRSRGGERR